MTIYFDLDIELNGKTTTLKWKLPAQKKISTEFGGMIPAYRAVVAYDLDAFTKIIAIGSERVLPDSFDEVQEDVFTTGMEALQPQLLKYLNRLVSGGKDPAPADDLSNVAA